MEGGATGWNLQLGMECGSSILDIQRSFIYSNISTMTSDEEPAFPPVHRYKVDMNPSHPRKCGVQKWENVGKRGRLGYPRVIYYNGRC
jgi:hypothetical protein